MFRHIVYVFGMYWRVSDVLRARKRFSWPVNKAVEEDEAGKRCPQPEYDSKRDAHIIDQLEDKTDRGYSASYAALQDKRICA